MNKKELKALDLADSKGGSEDLKIEHLDKEFLIEKLHSLKMIRMVEEKLAESKENGLIGGPVHLGAGQEAIAVGISANLSKEDRVFGAHRSHSHLLALNPDFKSLFAEVLGKETGFSKGMGGSMHLTDPDNGFAGSVPIVSGTVPLALGAAFNSKNKNDNSIGVAYIGDGAIEEGIVHESLNLARVLNIPVLFIVENNLFSSHMHMSLRQPKYSTTRFAEANDIESEIVDGNNLVEVYESSKRLIEEIRSTKIPKFIEAITYRHFGHVDFRRDIDVGVNRSKSDLENWMKRDPIIRLEQAIMKHELIKKEDESLFETELKENIENAWSEAMNDPYPVDESLLERVYEK